jgi:GTP cyclohydrolase I
MFWLFRFYNQRGDFRHDPSLKQEFFELVRQQEALLST